MKHIFTIHSHITYLAALGVVNLEKIQCEKVVLICNAGYKPLLPVNFNGIIVEGPDNSLAEKNPIRKIQLFSYSKNVLEYISNIIGKDSFIAYIDLMSSFNKYLAFHKNCTGFHIIEEGIVNYGEFYDLNLLTVDLNKQTWLWTNVRSLNELFRASFKLYRGRSAKMERLPIHPNIYASFPGVNAYCFSDLAFPLIPEQNRRLLDFTNLAIPVDERSRFPNDAWFWIGDTMTKSYGISLHRFKEAGECLMGKLGDVCVRKKIFVKFRGPETKEEKEITIDFLKRKGFEIEYIASDVMMELVFASGTNFRVCGIVSSLLIYAHNFGHKTYSMLPFIPDEYGVSVYKAYPKLMKNVYNSE
jgi:hypothetical protein